LKDSIQMLADAVDFMKDSEADPSGLSGPSLQMDRVHMGIHLGLKLLWCTSILHSGQMQSEFSPDDCRSDGADPEHSH